MAVTNQICLCFGGILRNLLENSVVFFVCLFFQIVDLADKISFYVMGCVSFFKSSRDDIKANAALFTGE